MTSHSGSWAGAKGQDIRHESNLRISATEDKDRIKLHLQKQCKDIFTKIISALFYQKSMSILPHKHLWNISTKVDQHISADTASYAGKAGHAGKIVLSSTSTRKPKMVYTAEGIFEHPVKAQQDVHG